MTPSGDKCHHGAIKAFSDFQGLLHPLQAHGVKSSPSAEEGELFVYPGTGVGVAIWGGLLAGVETLESDPAPGAGRRGRLGMARGGFYRRWASEERSPGGPQGRAEL